jgi:enhancer of polycomb-like protein
MSRPSFRPRPLDIHKKLPILKSVREFEDDDQGYAPASVARAGVLLRHPGELTASTANNAAYCEVTGCCCLNLNCNFVKYWS